MFVERGDVEEVGPVVVDSGRGLLTEFGHEERRGLHAGDTFFEDPCGATVDLLVHNPSDAGSFRSSGRASVGFDHNVLVVGVQLVQGALQGQLFEGVEVDDCARHDGAS